MRKTAIYESGGQEFEIFSGAPIKPLQQRFPRIRDAATFRRNSPRTAGGTTEVVCRGRHEIFGHHCRVEPLRHRRSRAGNFSGCDLSRGFAAAALLCPARLGSDAASAVVVRSRGLGSILADRSCDHLGATARAKRPRTRRSPRDLVN